MLFSNILAVVAIVAPAFALVEEKRDANRESLARMALAKARVARHVRRSALAPVAKRASTPYATTACPLSDFRNQQSRADRFCLTIFTQRGGDYTLNFDRRNAAASCVSGTCEVNCNGGYVQTYDSARNTVICSIPENTPTCGGPGRYCLPANPETTVACVNDRCMATGCTSGFTLNDRKTACYNYSSDTSNCGSTRNRCPRSYDGMYNPVCNSGRCSLDCPTGTSPGNVAQGTTCVPN